MIFFIPNPGGKCPANDFKLLTYSDLRKKIIKIQKSVQLYRFWSPVHNFFDFFSFEILFARAQAEYLRLRLRLRQ